MKALGQFIVKPAAGKLYDNKRKTENGSYLINTNFENHEATNRIAIVISTPINYKGNVREGSEAIVHHNVFRKYNDIRGDESYSSGLIKDDLYLVDAEIEIYAHRESKTDLWTSIYPYSFVTPIKNDSNLYKVEAEKNLYGIMKITNPYLQSIGVEVGDEICFKPDSEYEFNIDGEKMYRINSANICLKP